MPADGRPSVATAGLLPRSRRATSAGCGSLRPALIVRWQNAGTARNLTVGAASPSMELSPAFAGYRRRVDTGDFTSGQGNHFEFAEK